MGNCFFLFMVFTSQHSAFPCYAVLASMCWRKYDTEVGAKGLPMFPTFLPLLAAEGVVLAP